MRFQVGRLVALLLAFTSAATGDVEMQAPSQRKPTAGQAAVTKSETHEAQKAEIWRMTSHTVFPGGVMSASTMLKLKGIASSPVPVVEAARGAVFNMMRLGQDPTTPTESPTPAPADSTDNATEEFEGFLYDWLFCVCISAIVGCTCYKRRKITGVENPARPEETFLHGHFDCWHDKETLFCACCCPWLRWADTMNMAGLLDFWTGFIFFAAIGLLDYFYGITVTLFLLYWRQSLRERLGLPFNTLATCFQDFCFASWCCCCLIAQEARVLNEACRVGSLVAVASFQKDYEAGPTRPASYQAPAGTYQGAPVPYQGAQMPYPVAPAPYQGAPPPYAAAPSPCQAAAGLPPPMQPSFQFAPRSSNYTN